MYPSLFVFATEAKERLIATDVRAAGDEPAEGSAAIAC